MSSFVQFLKHLMSGTAPNGIKARTWLSIILTIGVLTIEIAAYSIYWDSIPDMISCDYDFNGIPNNIFEKKLIWYNVCLQIFICLAVFVIKHFSYKTKRIHNLVYDTNNNLIPIINKRFSLFAWETAMLFVTTEQGYIFDLIDVIENPMCDDIVTAVFLFWLSLLIIEFRYDIKVLKSCIGLTEN